MLGTLSSGNKIVVFFQPADLRCGRYGLAGVAESAGYKLTSGDWFVFFNKRRTATKILYMLMVATPYGTRCLRQVRMIYRIEGR